MAIDIATKNKMLIEINQKPEDIITAVQNDTNSRYLDVFLYDNGTPIDLTGCEVKIFMKKPESGDEIWNDGTITNATAGRCEFLFTTQSLAEIGNMEVQISIWQDNTFILSTEIFTVYVTPSLLGNSSVESSNEYGTLVVLFQNLYQALYLMETMVQNIGTPGTIAQQYNLDTMWETWEFLVDYMKGDLTDKIDEAIANASMQGVLDVLDTTTAKQSTSEEILEKLGIRRVQRGTGSMAYNVGEQSITLSGFTNVNKMFVLLNGNRPARSSTYSYLSGDAYLGSLTTTALTVKTAGSVGDSTNVATDCTFSYQVIEFY